jgi:myo-inositol-1(or 4)-monophosphatase
VSVAVETERDGRAVAAAIVLPATGGWLASGSAGPRGDAARIGVSDPPPERALLGFAVPGAPGPRRAAYRLLADIAPHVQDLRNSGSTVCDLAAVATGELDGFLSVNPAAWDVAAGAAIVRASGGTVRRWRRQDGLDLFVAGGRRLVDAIDELIGT